MRCGRRSVRRLSSKHLGNLQANRHGAIVLSPMKAVEDYTRNNTFAPSNAAFGTVTEEFAWPRVIQFGLKILF